MTENGSNMTELEPSNNSHNEQAPQVIDTELLIAEVKKHPVLYSRAQAEYFEKDARQKKWTEVCKALFQPWNKFSPRKKKEKVREVQNKWQKLKESFLKSYGGAHKLSPLAKKKRHQHLQSMSFLVRPAVAHDEDMAARVANNNNEDGVAMDTLSNEKTQEDVNVTQMPSTSAQNVANVKTYKNNNKPFVIPVPKTEEPKYDPIDENMHFAFMLVPLLRKLNSEQQFYAWKNIIEVIKNAGEMGPKKICVLQNELRYPEPEETSNLLQHDNINYTEPEQDAGLEAPAFSPSLGRPTNSQGEIMYPETDTEDLDEI